jgi:hypothetical protein
MARLCSDPLRLPAYERTSKVFLDHAAGVTIVAKGNVFRTFPLPRPPGESCTHTDTTQRAPSSLDAALRRPAPADCAALGSPPDRPLLPCLAAISDDGGRQFDEENPSLREKTVTCAPLALPLPRALGRRGGATALGHLLTVGVRGSDSDVPDGNVVEVRFSHDLGLMAVQRSDHELLIRDVEAARPTQAMLDCQRTRNARPDRQILDWWWVSPIDGRSVLLLVTTTAIELFVIGPDEVAQESFRPTAIEKVEGSWCRFEPTAEVLMVATGSASSMLKMYKINTGMHGAQRGGGFRGSPGGGNAVPLQKLPNIDVEMRGTRSGRAAAVRLERDDVLVAPLYNSLYVLRIERLERKLLLYPIGAPARPYEIKLFSQSDHLDVAVVDNVMILHDMAVQNSMMYDIKLSTEFPVVPPFSLLQPHAAPGAGAGAGAAAADAEVELYGRSWTFEQPDYICDDAIGAVYYIGLDLDEVVRMSTDKVWLMEYLLRRRGSKRWVRELLLSSMLAGESLPTVARLLKLVNQFYFFINYRVKKTTDKDEEEAWDNWNKRASAASTVAAAGAAVRRGTSPPPVTTSAEGGGGGWLAGVAIVDDHLAPAVDTAAAAAAAAAESSSTGSAQPAQASAEAAAAAAAEAEAEAEGDPVINQVEFYHSVLMPLQDRHAAAGGTADAAAAAADAAQDQDQQGGLSTSYLVAVLLEYIRSLHEHNIRVHRCFYTAVISALTQCSPPRYYQLHQLLQYHVLDDSVEVAMKVLALKTDYPPAAQQGIDMLHRLALHNDVVDVLLDDKQVRHTDTASAHTQTPV